MNVARFFIDRPVSAAVLSIVAIIAGALSVLTLLVNQYPEIAPPTVTITTVYPGANAKTVADTVATPLEEQINGVEHMLNMSSQSTNDGRMSLTVTFAVGTDLDTAQVQVQNRVAIAQPQLPEDVQRQGLTIKKASPDITLVVAILSPDESHDTVFLSNYATLQFRDEVGRLPGVGDITIFGVRDYSIRLWLDPDKLCDGPWAPPSSSECSASPSSGFSSRRSSSPSSANSPVATCSRRPGAPHRRSLSRECERLVDETRAARLRPDMSALQHRIRIMRSEPWWQLIDGFAPHPPLNRAACAWNC
ncbi:MAG: efflux RND transporter permease subunit [Chthoniobacteraceae bacterium]